jgi:hypothetical protein
MERFKEGDKIFESYISDNNKYNGKIATVNKLIEYNFYPKKDYSEIEKRTQAIVTYDDGFTTIISNIYRKESGIVSKVEKF